MNFLFHHHLALRDLGTPEAAVGAMLPDLWRMADRRVRPAVGAIEIKSESESDAGLPLARLLAGIEHHLVADKWFHRDPVFLDGEQRCLVRLRGLAAEVPRIGLFAHVLWELCLDGALLDRVGLFPVLHALREGFDATLGAASDRAAEVHHFERVGRSVAERESFAPRMRRLCAAIADGPWIDGYQSGEGLSYRIQGVRARLGMEPLRVEGHALLAEACADLLDAAVPVAKRILDATISR